MSSRRQFIKEASFASAAAFLASSGVNDFFITRKPKVIIIGAGFAGLAAAYKLHQRKIDFIVLEARNRISGRVFSHTIDPAENLVIELGAEWVGNSHKRIKQLCKEFDLELFDNHLDTRLLLEGKYFNKGEWAYSESWLKKYETLRKNYDQLTRPQQIQMDDMDWWRFLIDHGCDGKDLTIRELFDSTDFGESIRHVSAYAALGEYAVSDDTDEMDLKIRGGNDRLAYKFQDKIGKDKIKLEHAVDRIDQGTGVKVHCSNGTTFEGTHIICTVPTFSVKKIKWNPALPADTRNAINALQYCRINKNPMLFTERFWKDESFDLVTDTPGHYFYHGTKNQPSKKGVLISYSIGDKAPVIKAQTNEWRADMVNLSLKPAFGDIKHLLEKQADYYWGDDDYSKGAYAMYGTGQWFGVWEVLIKPFMRTQFAGEHLSDLWQGFMEGAIETGEAAAEKI